VFSAFVQDEITLVRDRLRVTLGSKLEHNDFTGVELQPSVRVAWTPCERNTIWAAVSRAVRTPSRAEDDVRILLPSPGGGYYGYFGDRSGQSEGLTAYELGWRTQPFQRFAFDLTAFYNQYDHLRLVTLGPPVPPSFPTFYSASILRGETYGAEAAASVNATDWWRLRVTYAFLRLVVDPDPRDFLGIGNFFEGDDPKHRVSLRSMMDLPGDVQFDVGVNFVDALRTTGISSYTTLDLRLAWRPTKNIEVSVVGQDLLDPQHAEFAPIFNPSPLAEVPRSVYAKLTLKF
jgi:iron complex outermembrane receptor protein